MRYFRLVKSRHEQYEGQHDESDQPVIVKYTEGQVVPNDVIDLEARFGVTKFKELKGHDLEVYLASIKVEEAEAEEAEEEDEFGENVTAEFPGADDHNVTIRREGKKFVAVEEGEIITEPLTKKQMLAQFQEWEADADEDGDEE